MRREEQYIEKKSTQWLIIVVGTTLFLLFLIGSVTYIVDPFFHYHLNMDYQYNLGADKERYLNDGIVRNFEYEAIITGTSMTENFKASEFERLFGVKTVKVPYSGGYFNEIDKLIRRAFTSSNNIKYVVRSLDMYGIILNKDVRRKETDLVNAQFASPEYLYNDFLFDDVNYLLNKSVLFDYSIKNIEFTKKGHTTTDFDMYGNWNDCYEYGAEAVLSRYVHEATNKEIPLTEEEKEIILENIQQNIIETALQHPETEFLLFFPPYSIYWWDINSRERGIEYWLSIQKMVIEELLKYENIKVFSFSTNQKIVGNIGNYKDLEHYGEKINSEILWFMREDEGLLTSDNYEIYLSEMRHLYKEFDYENIR